MSEATDLLVTMRRTGGLTCELLVPPGGLQGVMDLANEHFGDSAKSVGGPALHKEKAK